MSFGLLDGWHALGAAPGSVQGLAVVGGGARSALWTQLLADAIGVPMQSIEGGEAGAALGAARLAWLADGGDEKSVCRAAAVKAAFMPRVAEAALLSGRAARFCSLYPALRAQFTAAAGTSKG